MRSFRGLSPRLQRDAASVAGKRLGKWPRVFAIEVVLPVLALLCFTPPSLGQTDARLVVTVPAADRARLREDMRVFLKQTTALLDAAIEQDLARVAEVASKARPPLPRIRALAADLPMTALDGGNPASPKKIPASDQALFRRMQANLPPAFRGMLLAMRETIGEIERDAVQVADAQHTLKQLSGIQAICIACHDTYRMLSFDEAARLRRKNPVP